MKNKKVSTKKNDELHQVVKEKKRPTERMIKMIMIMMIIISMIIMMIMMTMFMIFMIPASSYSWSWSSWL